MATKTPTNPEYISPTPGYITLVASGIQNSTTGVTATLFEELKQCGFNAASGSITYPDIATTLTNAANKGIKFFLVQAHLTESEALCKNLVNTFKTYTGLGGWNLKTQITYDEMSETGSYKKYYDLIKSQDNSHVILIS